MLLHLYVCVSVYDVSVCDRTCHIVCVFAALGISRWTLALLHLADSWPLLGRKPSESVLALTGAGTNMGMEGRKNILFIRASVAVSGMRVLAYMCVYVCVCAFLWL